MITKKLIKKHIYYKIEQVLKKHRIEDNKINSIRDELFNELKVLIE